MHNKAHISSVLVWALIGLNIFLFYYLRLRLNNNPAANKYKKFIEPPEPPPELATGSSGVGLVGAWCCACS